MEVVHDPDRFTRKAGIAIVGFIGLVALATTATRVLGVFARDAAREDEMAAWAESPEG